VDGWGRLETVGDGDGWKRLETGTVGDGDGREVDALRIGIFTIL
jgi:hypothetical protein